MADGGKNDKMIPDAESSAFVFFQDADTLGGESISGTLAFETSLAVARLFRLVPPSPILKSTVHSNLIARFLYH